MRELAFDGGFVHFWIDGGGGGGEIWPHTPPIMENPGLETDQ